MLACTCSLQARRFRILCVTNYEQRFKLNKQIHLVAERFILKIHENTTKYTYVVDVLVSIRDLHQRMKLVPASSSDEGL